MWPQKRDLIQKGLERSSQRDPSDGGPDLINGWRTALWQYPIYDLPSSDSGREAWASEKTTQKRGASPN